MLMPIASSAVCASFVGFCKRISIVFSDVPASLPTIPAFAICAMAVVKSWIGTPDMAATLALIFSASPMSLMSALLAFAAAASRSATRAMSAPVSLASPAALRHAFSAFAPICAASAFDSCPAALIWSTPFDEARISLTLRPALLSSSMASPASLALVPGSVRSPPRSMAFC